MRLAPLILLATIAGAQEPLTLAELEARALRMNPTLRQSQAAVDIAAGLRKQAGRYPNPMIGAEGEELSDAAGLRGGEFGMFLEQRIITGGKLSKAQAVFTHQRSQAEAAQAAQRRRVLNAVRSLYYQALAAERLVEVETELARIANEAVGISQRLANVGQADRPDVLAADIEAQSSEMAVIRAEMERDRTWAQLAAAVGDPSLERGPLEGDLDDFPDLEKSAALARVLEESPELQLARAAVERAGAEVDREKAQVIPDIEARGGFRNNPAFAQDGRPVGREGLFEVGVDLPIFDRNRGAVRAAKAGLENSKAEVERVELSLRSRLAVAYQQYATSAALARRYQTRMLPRAKEAYDLYLASYSRMAAAYPQVLIAQRNYFQLQEDYVRTLAATWTSAVQIEGLLLSGGLDQPLAVGDDLGQRGMHGGMDSGAAH